MSDKFDVNAKFFRFNLEEVYPYLDMVEHDNGEYMNYKHYQQLLDAYKALLKVLKAEARNDQSKMEKK